MLPWVAAFGRFLPCKGMRFLTEQGKKRPKAAGGMHLVKVEADTLWGRGIEPFMRTVVRLDRLGWGMHSPGS